MTSIRLRTTPARVAAAAAVLSAIVLAGCGSGGSHAHSTSTTATTSSSSSGFTSHVFASGIATTISTPKGKVSINQPDDITKLGAHIFVAYQNNVGPQGEPTPAGSPGTGNKDSTVVEYSSSGSPAVVWDLAGHVDGLTADVSTGKVIATANEDANPKLYALTPGSSSAVSYQVPSLPSNGGLDAISFWHGMMLISGSAPGTSGKAPPQASYPAVYEVTLDSSTHKASVKELFGDEATAQQANSGKSGSTKLGLTDPDGNFVVPSYGQRFPNQFMLTSQGDYEDIFVADSSGTKLSVLKTSQSVDDTQWASGSSGTLYVTDASADLIYKVTGPFQKGGMYVAVTPCDAGNAPASCPSAKFPNNYLGQVNQSTGAVSKLPVAGVPIQPAGLLFVP